MLQEKYDDTLFIKVSETVYVSDVLAIIMVERLIWQLGSESELPLMSVEEYRELFADFSSTDEQVKRRLQYIEAFCRNVIKPELKSYVSK